MLLGLLGRGGPADVKEIEQDHRRRVAPTQAARPSSALLTWFSLHVAGRLPVVDLVEDNDLEIACTEGEAAVTSETEERAPRAPEEWANLDKPSAARIYDWYLGGRTNYAIDREFGKKRLESFPLLPTLMSVNRTWMGRVVRNALAAGITQFLDLGAGIPTYADPEAERPAPANVHDLLLEHGSGRVVYVDNEAVAGAHLHYLIETHQYQNWIGLTQEDLREPHTVINAPPTTTLLDLDQPVCVLLASVLHFLGPGDRPADIVAGYRSHLAPGSWIALSHVCVDDADPDLAQQITGAAEAYKNTQNPVWPRDHDEIAEWFTGTDLVPPGLVHLADWRPEPRSQDPIEQQQEAAVRGAYWCGAGQVRA